MYREGQKERKCNTEVGLTLPPPKIFPRVDLSFLAFDLVVPPEFFIVSPLSRFTYNRQNLHKYTQVSQASILLEERALRQLLSPSNNVLAILDFLSVYSAANNRETSWFSRIHFWLTYQTWRKIPDIASQWQHSKALM